MEWRSLLAGLAGAAGGALAVGIGYALIRTEADEDGRIEEVPGMSGLSNITDLQAAALKRLPNFRDCRKNSKRFDSHAAFVGWMSEAFAGWLPPNGRCLVMAHAARGGGWHVGQRPPLYWFNLWGQLTTQERIDRGELFTLLRGPGGKLHAFRAYNSPQEAIAGYKDNVEAICPMVWQWLEGVTSRDAGACFTYVHKIKAWFSAATRAPGPDGSFPGLRNFADDMAWIIGKHMQGVA